MNKTDKDQNHFVLIGLAVVLVFLIVCPIAAIFAKAVIMDGRFDLYHAWNILRNTENVTMIGNSFLLGVLVVVLSTVIAAPLAYLFSRTKFAKYKVYDIIFMIPFMTPPYIASMGWILFMQKKGLLQQLLPAAEGCEKIFFSLGGLVLVMSLHVFPFMLTMLKNAMRNIPSRDASRNRSGHRDHVVLESDLSGHTALQYAGDHGISLCGAVSSVYGSVCHLVPHAGKRQPDRGRQGIWRQSFVYSAAHHAAVDKAGNRDRLYDDLYHRIPGAGDSQPDRAAQHAGGVDLYYA